MYYLYKCFFCHSTISEESGPKCGSLDVHWKISTLWPAEQDVYISSRLHWYSIWYILEKQVCTPTATVVAQWNFKEKKNEPWHSSGGQLNLTDKPDAINSELLLCISFTV